MDLSKYTIRFKLFGIPIFILPGFWILCIVFSPFMSRQAEGDRPWIFGALGWIAALLVSFLAHELGHALAARKFFRVHPEITLGIGQGPSGASVFGGLTTWRRGSEEFVARWKRAFVSAAGPLAAVALAVAGLIAAFFCRTGFTCHLEFGFLPVVLPREWILRAAGSSPVDLFVGYFCYGFFWINTFWSVLNMTPIYPLDGGQFMMAFAKGRTAVRYTLYASIVFAFLVGGLFLLKGSWFAGIFFLYLGFVNYRTARALEATY